MRNQDRPGEAQQAGQQSVDLFRELSDPGCLGIALVSLAELVRGQGDLSTAHRLALEAAATQHEASAKVQELDALDLLGRIALTQGNMSSAEKQFREGLRLMKEVQESSRFPSLLEGLGRVLASYSRHRDAILLFGAADALREKTHRTVMQVERADDDRTLLFLRTQMDEDIFQKAWREGHTMTAKDVIDFVLEEN